MYTAIQQVKVILLFYTPEDKKLIAGWGARVCRTIAVALYQRTSVTSVRVEGGATLTETLRALVPDVNDLAAVADGEGAQVRDEPGRQQHVACNTRGARDRDCTEDYGRALQTRVALTDDLPEQVLQLLGQLGPARLLPAQAADELLGAVQLGGAQVDLVLQTLLLARHLRELVI